MNVVICVLILAAQYQAVTFRGTVVDPAGLPIAGASVQIKGTSTAALTDDRGHFELPFANDRRALVVSMPGFEIREVELPASPESNLTVQLAVAHVAQQVSVEGHSIPLEPGSFTLGPLDVVRTPGAQGDLLRALQGLPGVFRVDEGAGLFVRGGDTSETLVLLDGVTIAHPYRYETPTGGFRGSIDPFMTQGLSFSSGGFSARFGNALSAVLDLRGLSRPEVRQVSVTAGLAQVSTDFSFPIGLNAGLRLNAQRVLPRLLFAVNPPARQFDQYPTGWDVSGAGEFATKAFGTFKGFVLDQGDRVGVETEKDAFIGFLHSGTRHRLFSSTWGRPLSGTWEIRAAFGRDIYTDSVDVGVLSLDKTDRRFSGRVEIQGPAASWTLHAGLDGEQAGTVIDGQVPQRGGDFEGLGGASRFRVDRDDWRLGTYLEGSRAFGRLTPTFGVRIDRFAREQSTTADPRVSVAFKLARTQQLRIAAGLFHQAPSTAYFDAVRGAAHLPTMMAAHYVAGYELGSPEGASFLRIEGYFKRYWRLPLENAASGFAGDGYGSANGIDFFTRRAWSRLELRVSTSWLNAQRRWTPAEQRDRYPLPQGTWAPDFSIPWSGDVVANIPLFGPLAFGAGWRAASGRPNTPVVGVRRISRGIEPIYGPINSERLPHYQRLDLSTSALFPISGGGVLILFASVDNVLARRNFFEYAYSADYSVRNPIITTSPRTFYFGASFTR